MTHPTPHLATTSPGPVRSSSFVRNRWVQLTAGILGMVAVANFQYAWTLFEKPLERRHGWTRVEILDALNVYFVLAQTWLVPLEGYLAERFGPRRLLVLGGALAALAWAINANASSLGVLYAAQVLSGCGSGIVYSISMGNALKWFPDRRGLAAGLTAAAFGAGSAATILPILWTIQEAGYETAFLAFGLGQGLVVVLAGLLMRFPGPREILAPCATAVSAVAHEATPREMLTKPAFWLLYGMMTMGAIPGLLMLGQLKPMAEDFGVDAAEVWLFGVGLGAALPAALMLDRISGGLTRPVFGWLSDHIGREPAIFLAFGLEGIALLVLIRFSSNPVVFVLMSGLAFFGWGAVFSLFPAVSGDLFGRKFAATNYGLLYTAKGAASLLVALCNRLHAGTGNWTPVFVLMIAADWIAALLALLVLPWVRQRQERLATEVASGQEKA
ncbi:MAG: oxalate/formate MFS antiporter [Planctomycetes bacterium]|nr:oxalate/formate MFS antiporter [Planctomycetota bacterium]